MMVIVLQNGFSQRYRNVTTYDNGFAGHNQWQIFSMAWKKAQHGRKIPEQ